MLTTDSVRQLIEVLTLIQHSHARGAPLAQSYQDAVRDVSNRRHVRYQTIGDLCRRRLGLRDIDEFLELVRRWLRREPEPLRQVVRRNADHTAHAMIDTFLQGKSHAARQDVANSSGPVTVSPVPSSAPEQIRTQLEELRLRITPELDRRLQLARLAGIGATKEEAAVNLLERGMAAERERIFKALETI